MKRRSQCLFLPAVVFLLVIFTVFNPRLAQAQRHIPATGWTASPGPLAAGSLTQASGSLTAGSTSDSGYFRHLDAGEGDDFRVGLLGVSTSPGAVSGLMVRDSEEADAAFVFAGIEAGGETLVLYRHRRGEPVVRLPLGAAGASKWIRLVVGSDTVYAYDAVYSHNPVNGGTNSPGPWAFLAAIKVDLGGGGDQKRRGDLGGFFVSQGTTSLGAPVASTTLVKTPLGLNTWLLVGTDRPMAAGETVTVRLTDPGTAESLVYADAARAVRVAERDLPVDSYPVWVATPAARISFPAGNGGVWNNEVKRSAATPHTSWSAGAYSTKTLIGDGI